jgi:hypothetical protein
MIFRKVECTIDNVFNLRDLNIQNNGIISLENLRQLSTIDMFFLCTFIFPCARIRRDEKQECKFKWPHHVQRQWVTHIAALGFQAYEKVIIKLSPSVQRTRIPTVVL